MAKQSKKFLHCWIGRYIEDSTGIPKISITWCISDASLKGIAKQDLDDAAGGDLQTFLLDQIVKAETL